MELPRPLKRRRQSEPDADHIREKRAKSEQYGPSNASSNSIEQPIPQLCSDCSIFDFESMLLYEWPETKFGTTPPVDTKCPFCGLVWKALKLAWGESAFPQELSHISEGSLEIFFKSKAWWSMPLSDPPLPDPRISEKVVLDPGKLPDYLQQSENLSLEQEGSLDCQHTLRKLTPLPWEDRRYLQPRIVLAVNCTPPEIPSKKAKEKTIRKVKDRTVIAEFEAVPFGFECDLGSNRIITAVADEHSGDPNIYKRPIKPELNIAIINQWLGNCRAHQHTIAIPRNGPTSLFSREDGFRLVDVFEECLVQKHEPCEYAALSYVWGAVPGVLQTTRANVANLGTPKALSGGILSRSTSLKIPQTIADAMELLRRMDRRYLWVDALCIVQDDPEEKRRLIHGMNRVFESASFTVIATAGDNADAGLPGITPRTDQTFEDPVTIDNPGHGHVTLPFQLAMCRPSLTEQIRTSCWNTRAWTYQEQCLSRRCLYLTKNEAFFVCNDCHQREGYTQENLQRGTSDGPLIRTGPAFWDTHIRTDPDALPYCDFGNTKRPLTFREYRLVVQEYNKKCLKYSSDIFNAFEGIYNCFNLSEGDECLNIAKTQGIPARFLPHALLWFPARESWRREVNKSESSIPTTRISTWSWASWAGNIDFFPGRGLGLDKPPHGSRMSSMILRYHFRGLACHPSWDRPSAEPDRDCEIAVEKVTGLDLHFFIREESNLRTHHDHYLLEGEIGFYAVCISANTALLSRRPNSNIYSVRFPVVEFDSGSFRFDDDQFQHISEFVGITWAAGQQENFMVVLGVANSIFSGSRRVGIGTLQFEDDSFPGHKKHWRSMPWAWRFVRLR